MATGADWSGLLGPRRPAAKTSAADGAQITSGALPERPVPGGPPSNPRPQKPAPFGSAVHPRRYSPGTPKERPQPNPHSADNQRPIPLHAHSHATAAPAAADVRTEQPDPKGPGRGPGRKDRRIREPDARRVYDAAAQGAGRQNVDSHALHEANAGPKLSGKLERASRREPSVSAAAVVASGGAPRTAPQRASAKTSQKAATKSRKPRVYCGNNRFDPRLRANGGALDAGSRSRCFQQGFGAALFQQVPDEDAFLEKFSARYAPLVEQRLWYKNSEVPEGYQAATLSQCRLRGWGAGSAELARRMRAKKHHRSGGRAPSA